MSCESLAAVKRENETAELHHLSRAVGRSALPMGTHMVPTDPPAMKSLYQKTRVLKQKSRNKIKKTWECENEGHSFSLSGGQVTRRAPSGPRSAVFCEGDKWQAVDEHHPPIPIQVLEQHQWPPRAMHLSAVIFLKSLTVEKKKKKSPLPSSQASRSSQVSEERHSGAHHTPLWLFTIVLECCWGWELLETRQWPDWLRKTHLLMLQCPKTIRRLVSRLSKQLVVCHVGLYSKGHKREWTPSPLALLQTLLQHSVTLICLFLPLHFLCYSFLYYKHS